MEPEEVVGTVTYRQGENLDPACGGNLLASRSDDPVYEVEEVITFGADACPNGMISFEHDAQAATLDYHWTSDNTGAEFTGTLRRP